MKASRRKILASGVVVLAILILIAGTALIAWIFFRPIWDGGQAPGLFNRFDSNGEQIYWSGASQEGLPISARMQGMHTMPPGRMACVNCHGPDGRGGTVRIMMGVFDAPNIQYQNLISAVHADDHEEHPPYTDETLKRAITEGIGPDGEPLDWVMPRWEMSDRDLNDLIDFLKTLE